jgi:hypothetical protein
MLFSRTPRSEHIQEDHLRYTSPQAATGTCELQELLIVRRMQQPQLLTPTFELCDIQHARFVKSTE